MSIPTPEGSLRWTTVAGADMRKQHLSARRWSHTSLQVSLGVRVPWHPVEASSCTGGTALSPRFRKGQLGILLAVLHLTNEHASPSMAYKLCSCPPPPTGPVFLFQGNVGLIRLGCIFSVYSSHLVQVLPSQTVRQQPLLSLVL